MLLQEKIVLQVAVTSDVSWALTDQNQQETYN